MKQGHYNHGIRMICLATALLLLAGYVASTSEADDRRPLEIDLSQEWSSNDSRSLQTAGFGDTCHWLSYWSNVSLYWTVPDPSYGYNAYAQRFTTNGPESLKVVAVCLYDEGSAGDDDIYIGIHADSSGLPGTRLALDTLVAGSYVFYPNWDTANFEYLGMVLDGDFHVVFSSSGIIDYECLLSDEGVGLGRSSVRDAGSTWYSVPSLWGIDVNFLMDVQLCPLAYGERSVSLDSVYGLYGTSSDSIIAGDSVKFFVRMTGSPSIAYTGFSNGFRIHSPDGAEWSTTVGDTTGTIGQSQFDLVFGINHQNTTGSGADTVGFYGVAMFGVGIPAGFNDVAFTLTIGPIDPVHAGETICLDSSHFAAGGFWEWSTSEGSVTPDWYGPYCFTIVEYIPDRTTWYVDSSGSDISGDGSPGNPFRTIQHGIDQGSNGDTVFVMPGTYYGSGNRNISTDGKELLVQSTDGPSMTFINSGIGYYGFNISSGELQSTVIDGFAVASSSVGIQCSNSGITVRNCTFLNNGFGAYGGTHGRLYMDNCSFLSNDTAGIQLMDDCILLSLTNSTVANNDLYGLLSYKGNPGDVVVDSCDFSNNHTHFWGSVHVMSSDVHGGEYGMTGIMAWPAYLNMATNTEFYDIGTLVIDVIEVTELAGCTIRNNSGQIAEAYNNQRLYMEDCDIYDNTGNGIYVDATGGDLALLNMKRCTYTGNNGGITFLSFIDLVGIYGLDIDSCTIAYNDSTGVYAQVTPASADKISITNSIIASNGHYGLWLEAGNEVSCCDVSDNTTSNYQGTIGDQTGINGNISINPLFCDAFGNDYTLSIGSQCLPDSNSCGVQMGARGSGCSIGADEIRILRPLPGELAIEATQYPVQWLKGDNIGNVDVDYSITAGLSWVNIVTGYGGSEVDWVIFPVDTSTEALVRVYSSGKGPFGDTTGGPLTVLRGAVDDGSSCSEAEAEDSIWTGGADDFDDADKRGGRTDFPRDLVLGYADGRVKIHHGNVVTKCADVNGDTVCDGYRGLIDLASADANNDHRTDLVLANHDSGTVAMFLADGGGGFILYGGGKGREPVGTHPNDIGIADFNQDGNSDTWIVGEGPSMVKVMLGNGEGGYDNGLPWSTGFPIDPVRGVAGELTGDGFEDLAVIAGDGIIHIYSGYGDGTFMSDTELVTGHGTQELIISDFNKDGYNDIGATTSDDSGYFAVFMYDGGNFQLELYPAGVRGQSKLAVADFLGNGWPDIALISPPDDILVMLPGMNLESPDAPRFGYPWEMTVGDEPVVLEVADFNMDGLADIFIANRGDRNAIAFHGTTEPTADISLDITAPNGGEELWVDSGFVIIWTKGEGVISVDVQVSRNGGTDWETIAQNQTGLSYDWTVWGPASDNALVRLMDATVSARNDVSDAVFDINEDCCIPPLRGNVNYDPLDAVNIADLTFLVAYLFGGGDPPECEDEADVNASGGINIADLTHLVTYLFGGGAAPANCP